MMWRRGKHQFKPRLTLEHTGFSGESTRQWCLTFISRQGRQASCGLNLVTDDSPRQAAENACRFLQNIGAEWMAS